MVLAKHILRPPTAQALQASINLRLAKEKENDQSVSIERYD
jgi:hypothetical protein